MKKLISILSLAMALVWPGLASADEPLHVVATIKPLRLLATAVGGDHIKTEALLKPSMSPHDYQLRPSDRRMLDGADLVLWIGPRLEVFLQPLIDTLQARTRVVALQDAGDAHLWLDPIAMGDAAQHLAAALADLRPNLAAQFHRNADRVRQELLNEDKEMREQIRSEGRLRAFIVEHDGYQRFEQRYGLHHAAALTDSSELPPSPSQLARIQQLLESGAVGCVWRERLPINAMTRLLSGKKVKVTVIDALAVDQPVSKEGLVKFYRSLRGGIAACLSAA